MSKQSTSFEIGFALGSVVREFRRALSRPPVVVQAQAPVASSVQRIEPAMLAGPTAKELEHISDVPAIVRLKKVNLNDWYLVVICSGIALWFSWPQVKTWCQKHRILPRHH